jgi:ABC-type multidrug transport system ATPase subunit
VSLDIGAGEIVALVGANGSGKTTLAKLLCRLYLPQAGRILWDGTDTAAMHPEQRRRQVAVIFQDFQHYALPARDNIGLGRHQHIDDLPGIMVAARHAGAHEFLAALPAGYDTILGPEFSGGNDLSVGQWQRVALARAFFRDAPFIILDEPTAALDARAEHDLFQAIRTLCRGRSVLLISHRFSSVRTADRIYALHHGQIVQHGSHHQLIAAGGLHADLFTLQAAAAQVPWLSRRGDAVAGAPGPGPPADTRSRRACGSPSPRRTRSGRSADRTSSRTAQPVHVHSSRPPSSALTPPSRSSSATSVASWRRSSPTSRPSEVVISELSTSWSAMNFAISAIDTYGRNVLGPGRIACSMRRPGFASSSLARSRPSTTRWWLTTTQAAHPAARTRSATSPSRSSSPQVGTS